EACWRERTMSQPNSLRLKPSKGVDMIKVQMNRDSREVIVCLDEQGVVDLEYVLKAYRAGKVPDHDHLMSPSWGGDYLDEAEDQDDLLAVNHLHVISFTN